MPYAAENASEKILSHFKDTEMTSGKDYSGEWEIIVKYNGDITVLEKDFGVAVEILSENFAIVTIDQSMIQNLYQYSEIEFIEFPKTLAANITENSINACLLAPSDAQNASMTGSGVLIAVIDSGIDYLHPDFIDDDGNSRILEIWDQTATGTPPDGFKNGAVYTREQINKAIAAKPAYSLIPMIDTLGHGTAIAGIAAGNGRSRGGAEKGVAPEAMILAVKLGREGQSSGQTRTTELMRAIKYSMDTAVKHKMPLVINISYGTNNGPHDGHLLFEEYIGQMSKKWKTSIIVASGNEGAAGHHFSSTLNQGETITIEFSITENIKSMYFSLWKNFVDEFEVELISPDDTSSGLVSLRTPYSLIHLESTIVIISYEQSTQYNVDNEIFIQFQQSDGSINPGVWQLRVTGKSIVSGRLDAWLPTIEAVSARTAFMRPDPNITLTMPSCAYDVVTVGAYNASLTSIASFSGRGYTRNAYVKPDIAAPGVNVISTRAGGGYDAFSGTSVAAPFVSGAAAVLMQWGIINGNDPFLYGQRLKAFLRKGAKREPGMQYPNPLWGYGTLCLKQTLEGVKKAGGAR